MDLIWGAGVASTDAWIATLDGAIVSRDDNRVTDLVIKRGLIRPSRFAAPVERAERCDPDGIYLSLSTPDLSALLSVGQTETDSSAAVTSRTRVLLEDGSRLRLRGLRTSREDCCLTDLIAGFAAPVRRRLLVPVDAVTLLGRDEIGVSIRGPELDGLPSYRLDRDIEDDLWEALYSSGELSRADLGGIRLRVEDGLVTLEGNVKASSVGTEIKAALSPVDGVAGVTNRLVSDWDVDLAVASYISGAVPKRSNGILVHTQLGTVRLDGHIAKEVDRDPIVQGVRSIAGVVAVEDLIDVRPTASPTSGAAASDGETDPGEET